MNGRRDDWDFGDFFGGFGARDWNSQWRKGWGGRGPRRRAPIFEAGDMKLVILRLLREKPRHGYEIIKALEERMWGCYTPSPGAVYPTLQLLEDQGFVRAEEADGRKVYHITPDGERFLEEHRGTLDEIFERLRETVRDYAGGAMGDLNGAFGHLAKVTYKRAWRGGPGHPAIRRVVEILNRAAAEVEQAWEQPEDPAKGSVS
jgi:DNA-binding PadR family transcriptional regulator